MRSEGDQHPDSVPHPLRFLAAPNSAEAIMDILEEANDVIYIHNIGKGTTWVNRTGLRLLGRSLQDMQSIQPEDIVDAGSLKVLIREIRPMLEGRITRSPPYEIMVRPKNGSPVWLEVSGQVVDLGDGPSVLGMARDVTQRKHAQAVQDLLHRVATQLADCSDLDDGLAHVLRNVCMTTGWMCGDAWRPSHGQMNIVRSYRHQGNDEVDEFLAAGKEVTHRLGRGLIGQAWKTGKMLYEDHLSRARSSGRHKLAADAGVHHAIAIPVADRDGVVAILGFYNHAPMDVGMWDRAAAMIADQVAGLLGRLRVERLLRERNHLLEAQLRAMPMPSVVCRADGSVVGANDLFLRAAGVRRVGDANPRDIGVRPLMDEVDDMKGLRDVARKVAEARRYVTLDGVRYGVIETPYHDADQLVLGCIYTLLDLGDP